MLHLEGQKALARSRPELWRKLTDLAFLVQCIPDVALVREVQEKSASVVLRPGFSFARGELQLTIEKLQATDPESASFQFTTKGIGSSSKVAVRLHLAETTGGTDVQWTADINQLGGLLKAVPKGLIQAAAQKVITDLLLSLEAKV